MHVKTLIDPYTGEILSEVVDSDGDDQDDPSDRFLIDPSTGDMVYNTEPTSGQEEEQEVYVDVNYDEDEDDDGDEDEEVDHEVIDLTDDDSDDDDDDDDGDDPRPQGGARQQIPRYKKHLTKEQRAFVVTRILELNALDPGPKYATVRNEFGQKFRRPPPDVTSIRRIMKKFKDKHTLEDQHRGRSGRPRSVRNAVFDST